MTATEMSAMQSGNGEGLVAFLTWVRDKGLMKPATANSYRAAATKVLEIDENWESVDVTALDVAEQLDRFSRLAGHNYNPTSLNTYFGRFRKAVEMYRDYLSNPSTFRLSVKERSASRSGPDNESAKSEDVAPSRNRRVPPSSSERETDRPAAAQAGDLITYPFPMRSGATAYFNLPRELPAAEVERMCMFLKSLAIDNMPALPTGSAA